MNQPLASAACHSADPAMTIPAPGLGPAAEAPPLRSHALPLADRPVRWALFGTGPISLKFAAALRQNGSPVTMVVSRGEQGDHLARLLGAGIVVRDAHEAAAAAHDHADIAYIATPPALHREHACACLAAGLPVLIEKPLGASHADALAIREAARAAGCLAMEATWTRFLPALTQMRCLIAQGAIGEPHLVSGSFAQAYRNTTDTGGPSSHFDPALGGGALAHLGFYPLSLAQFLFGMPDAAQALGHAPPGGVEETVAIALRWGEGLAGSFQASLRTQTHHDFTVFGSTGSLSVEGPIWRPHGLRLWHHDTHARGPASLPTRAALHRESGLRLALGRWRARLRRDGRVIALPYQGNGYVHEIIEAETLLRSGGDDSATMPLDHSVALAGLIDDLREQVRNGGAFGGRAFGEGAGRQ